MTFETFDRERRKPTGPAGVCQDHTNGDLEAIFFHWQFLAAVAWLGYQNEGRGAVVVSVSPASADVSYASGVLQESYAGVVERYDPLDQLVIAVRHSTGEHVYQLSGYPSPRECFETGSLHSMNSNVYCVPCSPWQQ